MKVSINKNKCIGCGTCVSVCNKVFELKDGKAFIRKSADDKCAKEAADICPVQAIKIQL